jgi:hypothetical protein
MRIRAYPTTSEPTAREAGILSFGKNTWNDLHVIRAKTLSNFAIGSPNGYH